jgi:hypothetical protein
LVDVGYNICYSSLLADKGENLMDTQAKVDARVNGNRIVRLLVNVDSAKGGGWTQSVIRRWLGLSLEDVESAIKLLVSEELAYSNRGGLGLTEEGMDYSETLKDSPELASEVQAFKFEARTGLNPSARKRNGPDWQRSTIDRAAIPVGKPPAQRSADPEQILAKTYMGDKLVAELAGSLDVTVDKLRELYGEGRIRVCPGLDGDQHVGIFHRNGKGFRKFCSKCRKNA